MAQPTKTRRMPAWGFPPRDLGVPVEAERADPHDGSGVIGRAFWLGLIINADSDRSQILVHVFEVGPHESGVQPTIGFSGFWV